MKPVEYDFWRDALKQCQDKIFATAEVADYVRVEHGINAWLWNHNEMRRVSFQLVIQELS